MELGTLELLLGGLGGAARAGAQPGWRGGERVQAAGRQVRAKSEVDVETSMCIPAPTAPGPKRPCFPAQRQFRYGNARKQPSSYAAACKWILGFTVTLFVNGPALN